MKTLVTGGSGLVGRYVVDELRRDHQVDILDLRAPANPDGRHLAVDVLDADAVKEAIGGYEVVVHLAGIPHPLNEPAESVFRVNTLGTFHLLEACALSHVQRFIFISSESVLGFAFSTERIWPAYVPIDEAHPLRPQDPYGLSKAVSEQICGSFSRRTGMQTICLRPPWIWVPEKKETEFYSQLRAEHPKWSRNLWAYIHVFDVARAVRECVDSADLPVHGVYFITARDTWVDIDSRSLMKEFFPETESILPALSGSQSLISSEKARTAFGFVPQYSWRDILKS